MELERVLEGVPLIRGARFDLLSSDVRGIAYDSRKIEPGFLFFAFAGAKADGAQFVEAALARGALAVVADRPQPGGFAARGYKRRKDARRSPEPRATFTTSRTNAWR